MDSEMNYSIEIKPDLERKLRKLQKKDKTQLTAIRDKIAEVIRNPFHYKNLRHDLKTFKRVHIAKSFVLVFHVNEKENKVEFIDYDHHDNIYEK